MDINETYNLACNGDKSAEDKLYKQLLVGFRAIVQHQIWDKADGEEVAQEALVTVFKKYREIEIKSSFEAWAYRVLKNKILDYVKLKSLRSRKMAEFVEGQNPIPTSSSGSTLKDSIRKCFGKINETNKQHARILNLHFQGYSTDEICKKLKITPNNFYVSLSRARTMLAECLREENEDI